MTGHGPHYDDECGRWGCSIFASIMSSMEPNPKLNPKEKRIPTNPNLNPNLCEPHFRRRSPKKIWRD